MTRRVNELNKVAPEAYIEINPEDADKIKNSGRRPDESIFKEREYHIKGPYLGKAFKRHGFYSLPLQRSCC